MHMALKSWKRKKTKLWQIREAWITTEEKKKKKANIMVKINTDWDMAAPPTYTK